MKVQGTSFFLTEVLVVVKLINSESEMSFGN